MKVYELNMDGLVGPTHHYAGLGCGNLASLSNALTIANPAAAAIQGLQKMRLLHHLGVKQALIPPQQRPNLQLLYSLGFRGTGAEQIQKARRVAPELLSACFSASSMWTANAATVSASADTRDHRVHFTAANLISNIHRQQEAHFSSELLQRLFSNQQFFQHHLPLPNTTTTSDEGAANHNRLCANHNSRGINLFVYGKQALPVNNSHPAPVHFPARQTLEASQAVARNHLLHPEQVVFASQNPAAIDQGVFHNDVIAVANESVLLIHQHALLAQQDILTRLRQLATFELHIIEVSSQQISMADAVSSYLFNSQLVSLGDDPFKKMVLICPAECQQNPRIDSYIAELIANGDNPISAVHFIDLKQSMSNGGGPACLRLRVPLNEQELTAMHPGVVVDDSLLDTLEAWVHKHYRTQLAVDDLDDPQLIDENFTALDELSSILHLGSLYPFQRENSAQ